MNREQVTGQLRIFLPALLGLLGFNAIAPETLNSVIELSVNVGFSAFTVLMLYWSWRSHRPVAMIDSVSKLEEVRKPIVTTTEINNELKNNPKVVAEK